MWKRSAGHAVDDRRADREAGASPPPPPPPHFALHPAEPAPLRDFTTTPNGQLFVDRRGERWLVAENKSAKAADAAVPEDVDAVTAAEQGGYLFVGTSGRVYRSNDPLGVVSAPKEPPSAMRWVAASGGAVVGVDAKNDLVRTTDGGATWKTALAHDLHT